MTTPLTRGSHGFIPALLNVLRLLPDHPFAEVSPRVHRAAGTRGGHEVEVNKPEAA